MAEEFTQPLPEIRSRRYFWGEAQADSVTTTYEPID
jgi:hypothetical protein